MQQNLIIDSQPELFAKSILEGTQRPTVQIEQLTKALVLDSICRTYNKPILTEDGKFMVEINGVHFDGHNVVTTNKPVEMEYYEGRDSLEDALLTEMNIFMSTAEAINASRYAQIVAYGRFQCHIAEGALAVINH
ncbi:hypothetical protein AB6E89_08545 [Vibrio breoganii]